MAQISHTVSKAFKDFNISVNVAQEVVEEEFGSPEMLAMAIPGSVLVLRAETIIMPKQAIKNGFYRCPL